MGDGERRHARAETGERQGPALWASSILVVLATIALVVVAPMAPLHRNLPFHAWNALDLPRLGVGCAIAALVGLGALLALRKRAVPRAVAFAALASAVAAEVFFVAYALACRGVAL